MKIVQITDTHFVPPGKDLMGMDPRQRLGAAIADINTHHADAEFCVLSGDLANEGQPEAYQSLRECLSELRIPYHLMMGNHDQREHLRAVFPEAADDGNGFLQTVLDTAIGRFLLLDTHEVGENWGSYCPKRLAWLRGQLEGVWGKPIYLFAHHPPFMIDLPMDRMALRDHGPFGELLTGFPNVRHLFCGHVHRPIAGSWRGIPISTLRSTTFQVKLELGPAEKTSRIFEPPAYGVILADAERTIVHMHDFLGVPA